MANPSCVYVVMDYSEGDDVCTPYIECAYVNKTDAALDAIEKYIAETEDCYDLKQQVKNLIKQGRLKRYIAGG